MIIPTEHRVVSTGAGADRHHYGASIRIPTKSQKYLRFGVTRLIDFCSAVSCVTDERCFTASHTSCPKENGDSMT